MIQIFARNPNRWESKGLVPREIDAFHRARTETSIAAVAVHNSYLINLASPRRDIRQRSFIALLDEMERAEALSIPYLVMHPGSHMGKGEKIGHGRVSEALNRIIDLTGLSSVKILLETTAGQGTNLGYRFEHLAEIMEHIEAKERLGVCVDTCHVFAAGYDFRDTAGFSKLLEDFDGTIGLDYLKLFHINDSKKGLGSRIDRHEHPGQGFIGEKGLSFFLKNPLFGDLPFLLETPKGRDETGIDRDKLNLSILKRLMEE